jgi:chromatin segregation and condensation protein Rec8/ScpA/Scc1 (kleisin family)
LCRQKSAGGLLDIQHPFDLPEHEETGHNQNQQEVANVFWAVLFCLFKTGLLNIEQRTATPEMFTALEPYLVKLLDFSLKLAYYFKINPQ